LRSQLGRRADLELETGRAQGNAVARHG
jgi:hypothetical protein